MTKISGKYVRKKIDGDGWSPTFLVTSKGCLKNTLNPLELSLIFSNNQLHITKPRQKLDRR